MLKTLIVSSQEKIFVDDKIEKFPRLERISALGGETLNFQLVFIDEGENPLPARPLLSFNIKNIKGNLAECTTARDVRSVPVDRPCKPGFTDDNYLRTEPGIYPDLLTPLRYGGKIVPSQVNLRSVWLEVNIPEDVFGECEIEIEIGLDEAAVGDTDSVALDGNVLSRERLTVDVIPASLPENKMMFTQWFYCDCLASYYNVPVWSDRHWEIIESFAALAVKRGRNMLYTPLLTPALNVMAPFLRVPSQLVGVKLTNGEYSFDFSNVDRWVDMCDRIGVKYLEISHFYHQDQALHSAKVYGEVDGEYKQIFGWETLSLDPEYIRFLREMISAFVAHMKARGDDKRCYYHISDEPKIKYIDRFLEVKNNIVDLLEGYEIMDALSNYEFYRTGAVSSPVSVTSHIEKFIEENVPNLWTYYACNELIEYSNAYVAMPSWRTRSIGMQLYKYNIQGFLHWGYNYYNNRASGDAINPFVDLSGEDWVPAGDTFVVYPDQDGRPLESIRNMTLDEAMQDLRAMQLCEKYYSHEEIVRAMEEALGDEITFKRCAHTADEMLRVRAAINGMIAKALANK